MERLIRNKRLLIKILIVVFCVLSVSALFFIRITPANAKALKAPYIIDYIPIEKAEIFAENGETTMEPGSSVKLCVNLTPYYAVETAQEITYNIISGKQFATIDGDILTANTDIQAGGTVTVEANVDGVKSFNVLEIFVNKTPDVATFVPVDSVSLFKGTDYVWEGVGNSRPSVSLDSILRVQVYPLNATVKDVTYAITQGREYAQIRGSDIFVNDNLPAGNLSIKIQALGYGNIQSNEITVGLYVPAKEINFDIKNESPMSSTTLGETIGLSAAVEGISTYNAPTFIVHKARICLLVIIKTETKFLLTLV